MFVTLYERNDENPFKMCSMLKSQLIEKEFSYHDSIVKKSFEDISIINELHQYLSMSNYVLLERPQV